jgi:Icc-related predicted phosphoesterase
VKVYEADVAILGGDLTGKRLIPVIESEAGFVAHVLGTDEVAKNDAELDQMVTRIRNLGQYPVRMTDDEYETLARNPAALQERFEEACQEQVADWMRRAAERLEPEQVPFFVTGGNDDYFSIEQILEDSPYITNAEGKVVELCPGVEMISTGYGNPTPWKCPRDVSEGALEARIEQMASNLRDPRQAVFNLHVPPYGSSLDRCPKLDTSSDPPKPLIGEEAPAGSVAVRSAIERFCPRLSLHGHIHESPGIRKLGPTTCINPGSEYAEGVLRVAIVDLQPEGRPISAQLISC